MESLVDLLKAGVIVFFAVVIIVGASFVGAFIVPIIVVSILIYMIYLVIQDERKE